MVNSSNLRGILNTVQKHPDIPVYVISIIIFSFYTKWGEERTAQEAMKWVWELMRWSANLWH